MKVWELIEELEKLDGDAEACYEDQEYGSTVIQEVKQEVVPGFQVVGRVPAGEDWASEKVKIVSIG